MLNTNDNEQLSYMIINGFGCIESYIIMSENKPWFHGNIPTLSEVYYGFNTVHDLKSKHIKY